MEWLQPTYQFLHHAQKDVLPSGIDMLLFILKGFVSLIGTLVIFVGVIVGLYRFILLRFLPPRFNTRQLDTDFIRRDLGRTLVLGLEFIIAADVIETTTTPDYYSLGILAIIVVIRTFLSLTLNREISQLPTAKQNNRNMIK